MFRLLKLLAKIGPVILSGSALVLAYPPFNQGWLIWVAFLPILMGMRRIGTLQKRPFGTGYLLGLIYFGGTFWWIGHVTVPGIIALVLYLALYPALWLWMMERWFWPRCSLNIAGNIKFAVVGASLWVTLEWWRGWFLTGFGWNNLAVAQHTNIPLIQLAGLGGAYLLSWLIMFVNVATFRMLSRIIGDIQARRPRRPFYELSIALVLVAVGFAWGLRQTMQQPAGSARTLRYACVQGNIPQSEYVELMSTGEILKRYEELSELAVASRPQLLLWPEASTTLGIFNDPRMHDLVTKFTLDRDYYFLLGATDYSPKAIYNGAHLFYPGGEGYKVYHKNRLVIFGEYVPLVKYLPILRKLVPFGLDFTPGEKPELFELPSLGISLTPLICFEDTLPDLSRKAAALHPDILINITNDSWFHESPGAAQHLANAVLRTVETGKPLIRCANTGVTCEVSQHGVIRARLTNDGSPTGRSTGAMGVLSRVLVWYPQPPTLYQRWGDWVPAASALICLVWLLPLSKRKA